MRSQAQQRTSCQQKGIRFQKHTQSCAFVCWSTRLPVLELDMGCQHRAPRFDEWSSRHCGRYSLLRTQQQQSRWQSLGWNWLSIFCQRNAPTWSRRMPVAKLYRSELPRLRRSCFFSWPAENMGPHMYGRSAMRAIQATLPREPACEIGMGYDTA